MKLVVVIGGISSGKSSVSRLFSQHGAATIDLDVIGHDVLHNQSVKTALAQAFGEDIFDQQGEVVRPQLAKKAFANPEATATLNGITHAQIISDAWNLIGTYQAEGYSVCVVEISPYDGPQGTFGVFTDKADECIAVVAPLEQRIKRAVAKGFAEEDARNRMSRQSSDDQRRQWATRVVENNGTAEELSTKIEHLWTEIAG